MQDTYTSSNRDSSSVFYKKLYGVSMSDILKYILEGLAVSIAAFFISPKNRKDFKSIILIGFSAALIFFIIDKFAPKVSAGTRQGSGFGIGFGLVGGNGDYNNKKDDHDDYANNANIITQKNNVVEETYIAETPTSISLNDRAEKFFDYGNSKGNQPLTGTGKPEIVKGTSDFDDTLSTTSNESYANVHEDNENFTSKVLVEENEAFINSDYKNSIMPVTMSHEEMVSHDNLNSFADLDGFEDTKKQTSWYPIGSIYNIPAHNTAKYS